MQENSEKKADTAAVLSAYVFYLYKIYNALDFLQLYVQSWFFFTVHQLIQICRTLYVEFALLVLQGCYQRRIIDALHGLFDGAARVLYDVFHQLAQGVIGEIGCYLVMIGLVHTFLRWFCGGSAQRARFRSNTAGRDNGLEANGQPPP